MQLKINEPRKKRTEGQVDDDVVGYKCREVAVGVGEGGSRSALQYPFFSKVQGNSVETTNPVVGVDGGGSALEIAGDGAVTALPEPDIDVVIGALHSIPEIGISSRKHGLSNSHKPSTTNIVESWAEAVVILSKLNTAATIAVVYNI